METIVRIIGIMVSSWEILRCFNTEAEKQLKDQLLKAKKNLGPPPITQI